MPRNYFEGTVVYGIYEEAGIGQGLIDLITVAADIAGLSLECSVMQVHTSDMIMWPEFRKPL